MNMKWNNDERPDLTKIILGIVAVTSFVAVATIVPGAIKTLHHFGYLKKPERRKYYLNRVVERLKQQGLIVFEKNGKGQNCARLTSKGKQLLKKYELKDLEIKKPRRWDGKYRVIIFDIKEGKRQTRDELRIWLNHLGFIRLQNSVWVFPYECQEVIVLLKSHFHIGKEVLYLTVESIENDTWVKKVFDIS